MIFFLMFIPITSLHRIPMLTKVHATKNRNRSICHEWWSFLYQSTFWRQNSKGINLLAFIRESDMRTVVLIGLSDSSSEISMSLQRLIDKGIKPLENVTCGDILWTVGTSNEMNTAHPDYVAKILTCNLLSVESMTKTHNYVNHLF